MDIHLLSIEGIYLKEKIYFIDDLYQMRVSYDKTHPMNLICKLLMNSCYGKFGQTIELPNHIIVNFYKMNEIIAHHKIDEEEIHSIIDVIELINNKYLISYYSIDDGNIHSNNYFNISIAASVTAYSRIYMSHFLGDTKNEILYTDTDSFL